MLTNHFDLYQSILLPHWSVPVCPVHTDLYLPTVTTLICPCLHTGLYLSVLTCVSLYYCYHPDLYLSILSPLICTCLSCYHTDLYLLLQHWPVRPVITDMCMSQLLPLTCVQYMSLLLPLWLVLVSTVTTLIYTCLPCYHTDLLYLSSVTTLTCPSLLPHWHVPVSTVTTDLYLSLLLSHWPITTDLYLALLLY